MAEVASGNPGVQRRRSERISKSLPLIVRGIDLLGQPFEERTSTMAVNLHGCRYVSKHHLPKNTWVTLEVPEEPRRRHVRARVAWIQRPHSVREFFQIAVELESPSNIWNVTSPPVNWQISETVVSHTMEETPEFEPQVSEPVFASGSMANFKEGFGPGMTNEPSSVEQSHEVSPAENPLLRQWSADLERHANAAAEAAAARSIELVERRLEEFARVEQEAGSNFSAQAAAKQQEFLDSLKNEFEIGFRHVRDLLDHIDQTAEALRAEGRSTQEAASRLAQARLEAEAAEAARNLQPEVTREPAALSENDIVAWRGRLESEMAIAQSQWNELLQSSLDSNVGRLVEQLAGRSEELLRSAEQRISDRFAELRQPLGQMSAEARETLSSVRSSLEEELRRASSSLADVEHATTRMREHSAQLEATTHNTLDELHRRLENILQAQTDEMHRRAEHILSGVAQRLSPSLDSLGQQAAERAIAEIDSKLGPRVEHASHLVHALASRGAEADESLRLHRERLRQVSENNLREAAAQTAATISGLRGDFESARREALAKWNEELDASAVRASHVAAESIERSSEWFQQEARSRLQVLVEQTAASAAGTFEAKAADAARHFESRLEEQFNGRLAQVHEQLNGVAADVAGRTRSQLDEAAEAAAASFGQVLRRVSEQETENFTAASRNALAERERELGTVAAQLLQNLEANARASTEEFRAQMASQLDASIAEGRSSLAAEFASALNAHRADRETHERHWSENLQRMSDEAVARHQDRLQSASDSWVVSSVRRLNEHGQTSIESLIREADDTVRESCAKFFQNLSQALRDRSSSAPLGFTPGPEHDVEGASQRGESANA